MSLKTFQVLYSKLLEVRAGKHTVEWCYVPTQSLPSQMLIEYLVQHREWPRALAFQTIMKFRVTPGKISDLGRSFVLSDASGRVIKLVLLYERLCNNRGLVD